MSLPDRASGILLHVTSLPGPHGIGDFGPAAFDFVGWLARAGQRLWQWLPTTPIGPGDSPYQSVSAFAGSPLMVALEPLVAAGWLDAVHLPDGGFDAWRVDFGRVVPWRLAQLRRAHAGFVERGSAADRAALQDWARRESAWLDDYTLFMALEGANEGRAWWHWDALLARRDPTALAAARTAHAAEIDFWRFVQWQFDAQCAALRAHAQANGVRIIGDLPIFVAHHSADCWARPELYDLGPDFQPSVVAGVPPDALGPLGQRWGNPLYRWDAMKKDGYRWWIARTKRALEQADGFRIDHFRGFAGYYEIPATSPDAREGTWRTGPGQALFRAIEKDLGEGLPIIAEDLGFITPDVHALRDALKYPGMKILQFGFGGDAGNEFLPHNYRADTVVYTGTHDNDTVRGWWHATSDRERHFAGVYMNCSGDDVHWAMIRTAMHSVSRLAVFPLQDVLGLPSADRMNTPGTLGGANWTWRCRAEQLADPEPPRVLALLAAATNRGPFEGLGLGAAPPAAPVAARYDGGDEHHGNDDSDAKGARGATDATSTKATKATKAATAAKATKGAKAATAAPPAPR